MTVRAAVYQGKRAQKKYSLADKRRVRAAELAEKGKTKRAARKTKRADVAERAGDKAAKRYTKRQETRSERLLSGKGKAAAPKSGARKPGMKCGTKSGGSTTRGGVRCGTKSGRGPSARGLEKGVRRRVRKNKK